MNYPAKVNISYRLRSISEFISSVERAFSSLNGIGENLRTNCDKAEEYLHANLENIEKFLKQSDLEAQKTEEIISEVEYDRLPDARSRREKLMERAELLREEVSRRAEAYRRAAQEETRVINSPPKKQGEGPEADAAFKQANRAYAQDKALAQKAVRSAENAMNEAKHALQDTEIAIGALDRYIRGLENALYELRNIQGRIRDEHRRLETEKRNFEEAGRQVQQAYSNFTTEKFRAENTLRTVLERAENARSHAHEVNATIEQLSDCIVRETDPVAFTSIADIDAARKRMETAVSDMVASGTEIKRKNEGYRSVAEDAIMNAATEKLTELVSIAARQAAAVEEKAILLASLAASLNRYEFS